MACTTSQMGCAFAVLAFLAADEFALLVHEFSSFLCNEITKYA